MSISPASTAPVRSRTAAGAAPRATPAKSPREDFRSVLRAADSSCKGAPATAPGPDAHRQAGATDEQAAGFVKAQRNRTDAEARDDAELGPLADLDATGRGSDGLPTVFELRSLHAEPPARATPSGAGSATLVPPAAVLAERDAVVHATLDFANGSSVRIVVKNGREVALVSDDHGLDGLLGRVRQKLRGRGYACATDAERQEEERAGRRP